MKKVETPFFFQGNGYRLFGVLHEASGPEKKEGFVFCAPFAEEKLWTHRVFVNFARQLANKGYPVLRFDYMGNGDSEGNFQDTTVQSNLIDIKSAIHTLIKRAGNIPSISLLGIRFGATLAALSAEENVIDKLILWEPIIDGVAHMREMLRINLATQSSIYREIRFSTEVLIDGMKNGKTANVDGYEMTGRFYEQAASVNLLACVDKRHQGKSIIIQINKKENPINHKIEQLKQTYVECSAISVVEEPFWKEIRLYYSKAENLFNATLEWLEK